MLTQQLQDLHESARALHRTVDSFQFRTKAREACGKLPVTKDRRVIERTRLFAQRCEIVDRVENHRLFLQGSLVSGHDLALRHDHDAIDIALDRYHLIGKSARDAVSVVVEGDGLEFVDRDRRTDQARVEPMRWQQRRRGQVFGQAVLDREWSQERLHDAIALRLATFAKEGVQFLEIGDTRDWRGEPLLHGLDGPFGVGLLVAACRHAEEWSEDVMARQRRVPRLALAFSPHENQRGDGSRVVPPDFLGHGSKELEGRDHPFEDCFGTLKGERHDEGSIRVRPGHDQERHEPATVREIDVDVAEIGFEALPREMTQRDERFLMPASVLPQIALHLSVPTTVIVFVADPPEHLSGGMPLLEGGGLVVDQDLIDDRLEWPQERGESIPRRRQGIGLGLLENLPDGVARMLEFAGDLADGLAIAPRSPNGSVVVHRKHVLDPP